MRSTSPPFDATLPTTLPLRILTHNIRYATSAPFPGELPWPERREHVVAELRYHTRHCATSIICLQEVLHAQLLDILTGLNSATAAKDPGPPAAEGPWRHVGVGRDDGQTGGEYSPLLYRADVWHVERSFTVWLSPRPWEAGSKGWDAASVRIVTVAVLAHRGCGRRVLAANTHLDDQGSVSRREGARLIVRTLQEILAEGRVEGGFLAGDLNSEVGGEAYRVLNEERSGLVDFRALVGSDAYGDEMTYTGFDGKGDGEGRTTKIDFIHLSKDPAPPSRDSANVTTETVRRGESESRTETSWAVVQGYAVLPNLFDDGVYLSDHRAVVGDVRLLSMPRP